MLKDYKLSIITTYLDEYDDKESIDDEALIKELSEDMNYTTKIECKALTRIIDFSTITYTKEDIETAKKDNFYGKLLSKSNISESKCLNAVVFPDLERSGEKCCYTEMNYKINGTQKNDELCLSLSNEERKDFYFLEIVLNGFATTKPFQALIICDGFNYIYDSSTGQWKEITSSGQNCEDITYPSKTICNNVNTLYSECCYEKEDDSSKGKCILYDPKVINYEGYEEDKIKDLKIYNLAMSLLYKHKDEIPDNDKIIEDLEKESNSSNIIECKTFSKTINYSAIKYTQEDIEIGKQDNFCRKLVYGGEDVSEQQCLNGVVFSDLAKAGEKCCYFVAELKKINCKYTHCFSLSQT